MLSSRKVVARFKQTKNEGVKARGILNNSRIQINNLIDVAGRKGADLSAVATRINTIINDITSVVFGLHLPEVKKHITDQDGVIGNLRYALSNIEAGDPREVQVGLSRAWTFLGGAIDMLAENPDTDEQKEHLAGLLYHLVPNGNTEENWYQQAIKLSKQLSETEKGKSQAFFAELTTGLQAALDGHLELRRAAAFAFKMLPKVR